MKKTVTMFRNQDAKQAGSTDEETTKPKDESTETDSETDETEDEKETDSATDKEAE